ncbi:MAG: DUF2282 domain-containing protein [Sphingomonadales bacterium]|nr:DUF2282 domain-containing protein [Sphingomonadales bacterium]
MKVGNISKSAVVAASAMAFALTVTASPVAIAADKKEKCYGIAAKGKNDCATANSSCAGSSTEDRQADAWIYVPAGTCAKIAGGSTTPQA